MNATETQPSLFLVGSFASQLSPEAAKQMSNPEVLEHNLRVVMEAAAPYLHVSVSDTESTPQREGGQKYYAAKVLPKLPGVKRYPGPHTARTLLSASHYYLDNYYDSLPYDPVTDLGQTTYANAKEGTPVVMAAAAEFGRPELLNKVDVPEPAMGMAFFGLDTLSRGVRNAATRGLWRALRHRDSRELGTAFWDIARTYEQRFRAPMEAATLNQIHKIAADPALRGHVELQVSAPITHGLLNLLYLGRFISPRLVSRSFLDEARGYLGGSVARVLNGIPADIPRVVHACHGEVNPAKRMGSVYHPSENHDWSNRATVDFANEILQQTHPYKRPRLIHAAITPASACIFDDNGRHHATRAKAVLSPLERWPKEVAFAAGMATHAASVEQTARAYRILRDVRGGEESDVALACGSGRQKVEVAGSGWGNTAIEGLKTTCRVVQELRRG